MSPLIIILYPLFSVVLAAAVFCVSEAAPLYRWVDEDGRIHYADTVPPQHSKYRRDKLNDQGLTVDVVEESKTEEEHVREKKLEELRSATHRLLQEQLAGDRTLLRTFRSEEEIRKTLNAKLNALEFTESATRANIEKLESQLDAEEKVAADFETNGRAVPEPEVKKILAYREQIASNYEKIRELENQKWKLRDQFAANLKRFEALTQGRQNSPGIERNQSFSTAAGLSDVAVLGITDCPNERICGKTWDLARNYLVQHSSTNILLDTDLLILTSAPENDNDLALSLAKIQKRDNPGAQLFLAFRCNQNGAGEELCPREQLRDILAGFRQYVTDGLQTDAE